MLHPRSAAPEVCRFFRDFAAKAPRELAGGVILMHAPPAPFVPPELQGKPALNVMTAYFGDLEEGEELLRPLREFGSPAVDLMGPIPYVDFQAITDPGNPPGRRNYWRSDLLTEATDEAIDALIAAAATATSPTSVVILALGGGAVADVPADATALSERSAPWFYHCYGSWMDPSEDERHKEWVRATEQALRPWSTPGMPLNFTSDVDQARVEHTFGAQTFARLVALKDRYDPDNVFRMNQNIRPSG
jgi:hypothetical protein